MARPVRWDLIADPSRFNRGFRDAERTSGRFQRHMQGLERSNTRFTASMGRIGPVAVRAVGGATVAIGGLAAAGAVLGIKTAANLETATVGFTRLLGSGQKAQRFLAQLKSFAAKTPFELPGLVDASRALIGAGTAAKDVIPILTDLGDAAGALGLDQERFGRVMTAVTQIMNKGKLQAEELMQITEAGIPVWQLLAKATGKPVPELQKLMQAGKLLSKDVLPLLFQQMHKDYGGGMVAQSKTLAGVWSTVKDTIALTMAGALQPLLPLLKTALPAAAGAFQAAVGKVVKFFTRDLRPELGKVKKAWDDNKASFETLATSLGTGDEKMKTSSQHARDLAGALASLITNAGKVARVLDQAGRAMDLVAAVVELGAAKIHLAGANVVLAIGKMAEWMARLGVGAGHLLNAIDRLSGGTGHAGDSIIRTFQGMQRDIGGQLRSVREHISQSERKVADFETRVRMAKERTSRHWHDAQAAAARELGAMRTQMTVTQRKVNSLHGKTIAIKATASLTGFGALGGTVLVAAAHGRSGGGPIAGVGTATSDSNLYRLSKGEHVLSAREVRGLGGHGAVERIRTAARGGLGGFATGGPVLEQFQAMNRGIGRIQPVAEQLVTTASIAIVKKAVQALLAGFGGGLASIKRFIMGTDRLPYRWGAAGPSAYDCSGIVGAVYGLMTGRGGGRGQRYFTTGSIGTGIAGIRPGLGGLLDIGVRRPSAGRSGHMAGRYGGLGFEARSTASGIIVGPGARPPGSFAVHFHVGAPGGGGAGAYAGLRGTNQHIVREIFAGMFGWGSAAQWNATNQLVSHESGWRNTAQNPTSSAYGLFQFLNSTWASVGGHKTSDPRLQAIYGGRYIKGRYHSPIGAWSFWQGHHWYDQGGWLPPGLSLAFNGTGRPEPVGPAAGGVHLHQGAIQVYAAEGMSERRVAELVVDVIDERARRARKGPRA